MNSAGCLGKFETSRSRDFGEPFLSKNQKFWNCPGFTQRHPGVLPEHLGGHFAAQKPPLTVFSETPFFLQPGRLLAPLGVSRGHWASPLGPRGGFTSSTWCEALFLHFGIFQKSGWGRSGDRAPCTRRPPRGHFRAHFSEFHEVWPAPAPCKHTENSNVI